MLYKIYIVEDEMDLARVLKTYLEKDGYQVTTFENGEAVMPHIDDQVHIWLLDIMLTGEINGFDIIKKIREKNQTPVIFLSARNQEIDRIMGLEMGSDDYITKPFSPREVVLRVSKLIQRVYNTVDAEIITHSNYSINTLKRLAYDQDQMIDLTSKEMDLLITLVQNINQAFTREQLLNLIWGDNYFCSDRVVDDLVKRLRKKMARLEIETIYGYGYRLK
ncbi:MAG: response regulator transcription factor [Vallitaleaceae bacterium]|nr:response regulator transcription factor [Vallitaleaceae bacterium]